MTTPDGAHLDLERLADLDAGVLPDEAAAEARRHLAGCAECQENAEALTDVRRRLTDLPDEPMPAEVWSRLSGALEAAPAPVSVLPAPAARRNRLRSPGAAALAAVAAAVALIAAIAIGAGGNDTPSVGPEALGAASSPTPLLNPPLSGSATAPGGFPIVATGTTYRAKDASAQLAHLVARHASGGGKVEHLPGALDRFADAAQVQKCVQPFAGGTQVTPVVVDLAEYTNPDLGVRRGAAVVVVLPTTDPRVDEGYIFGADCTKPDSQDVKQVVRVDLPAGSPAG